MSVVAFIRRLQRPGNRVIRFVLMSGVEWFRSCSSKTAPLPDVLICVDGVHRPTSQIVENSTISSETGHYRAAIVLIGTLTGLRPEQSDAR
jgi:hypothetical protein